MRRSARISLALALVATPVSQFLVAGDATSIANPALSANVKAARSGCAQPGEIAVNPAGKIMKCQGGFWTIQGISDVEYIQVNANPQAYEIGQVKILSALCPAGKRVIGGGCGYFSGNTFETAQNLVQDFPTLGMEGWQCGYGPLNNHATDAYQSGGAWYPAAMSAHAYCGYF